MNVYPMTVYKGRSFSVELDYVFLPEQCSAPSAEIVRCMLSDHRPVLVEFSLG